MPRPRDGHQQITGAGLRRALVARSRRTRPSYPIAKRCLCRVRSLVLGGRLACIGVHVPAVVERDEP